MLDTVITIAISVTLSLVAIWLGVEMWLVPLQRLIAAGTLIRSLCPQS